jgi:hypothetical protein
MNIFDAVRSEDIERVRRILGGGAAFGLGERRQRRHASVLRGGRRRRRRSEGTPLKLRAANSGNREIARLFE